MGHKKTDPYISRTMSCAFFNSNCLSRNGVEAVEEEEGYSTVDEAGVEGVLKKVVEEEGVAHHSLLVHCCCHS